MTSGQTYTANVYSSYETLPAGTVEYPENLDLVNYIINQEYADTASNCDGTLYTYGDVQKAIWTLIEDDYSTEAGLGSWNQCRVDEILGDARANGEDFVPDCGDVVAVILVPVNSNQLIIAKVTFGEVPVAECKPGVTETAWGDGTPFPGKNWATYFEYGCPVF